MSAELDPIDDLVATLTLEEVGTAKIFIEDAPGATTTLGDSSAQVFLGRSQKMAHGRVFGGQVLAQGAMAASLTLDIPEGEPERPIHSLHAYFMRPGDDTQPIRFAVERMMDGNSFSTRRVHAIQHGRPILSMSASFQVRADGFEHQDDMPDVPGPEDLPSMGELLSRAGLDAAAKYSWTRPIEQRPVGGEAMLAGRAPAADKKRLRIWMKAVGPIPTDLRMSQAILAYTSDYALLQPALAQHDITMLDPRLRIASLDHAMWFHRPASLDQWLLFDLESPSAQSGRSLGWGRIYAQDGTMVASIAQEGMTRIKQSSGG